VTRLGGDEFVVISRKPDLNAAAAFRGEVAESLENDIVVAGHEVTLSASIGLATTANSTMPAADLLHAADLDMYTHKMPGHR
jgi:diguanylate cyclase (GGDEF)-like protein